MMVRDFASQSCCGCHKLGSSDCLTKTQQRAKPQGDVYAVTPAQCWKVTRISSDLHEWRNDCSAVSTTDPAKLKYE